MRKFVFLILIVLGIINFCYTQNSGIISYKVVDDWTKKMATCDYISKAERERSAYAWGGRTFDRKAELQFNENSYRFEFKDDENDASNRWRKNDYVVFRDRDNGQTFDVMTVLDKDYVITDTIECQNWKILNDMKEVAGHICMNASYYDTIRKKEVLAWFALDLPISLGPNKYCGLPGMILEIFEANGAVVYTATHILLSEEKIEIKKPSIKKNRKAINFNEYNQIVIRYINESKKMQRPYFWGISF